MSARDTALRVLSAGRTASAWADASLKAQLQRDGLSGAEAGLATRMVYGVLQNRALLDFYLGAYCTQKVGHLQPPLADILRLGAYQILFLDKVPDRAAVNESVELAKRNKRGQAAGLVNAVLRKVSLNKDTLPPIPRRDEAQYLSVRYSHPKWLVKRLLTLLGREEAEAFLAADNGIVPLTVQVNTLKTTAEDLAAELTAAGVTAAPHPWVPDCLELSGSGDLTALEAFQTGKFFVQDPAAKLVSLISAPKKGQRVIDVCAAPGGKSFGAAIAMEDRGEVLACDLHENKLSRIEAGSARLGLKSIWAFAADGTVFRPEWAESADVVLVDAPCSGLGIIRKKPDIRYKSPDDLFTLTVAQSTILENAARYVKPGGTLIYSTCTILPEENGQVVDGFLSGHPEFSRETFTLPAPMGEQPGELTLWPHRHGTDGFYICRLRRN
ncbi:16S rRNA (cytosine(967)-C(5))-methyltransferase RsmB [Oscillibacter ruminantium]|uniref:16S rRNA (cytosine(967)-C(5))-methyltransferase RsmB n=1 Tax=Oscillibacter ruminantium TaxID=1263547 RepID=UPI0002DDBDD4|nr:16S rRNA (cytosine(967)-C(5))-methyltransferase RsmB [Oscillibacter ruminantium]